VGLTVSKTEAGKRFAEALAIARSDADVPTGWVNHTERMHTARSASFTPMLGTALLAKATDRRVDAFALQEAASHRSYSARGLATGVLVPQCVLNGIDLRTGGAEPLNNSPFFREEKVGTHLKVHRLARGDLDALLEALTDADFLEGEDAVLAFAAFLRTRERLTEKPQVVDPGPGVLGVHELGEASRRFIGAKSEGGRRGQAFVAACLDLVFSDVTSGGIHDPDVKVPGDVLVGDGAEGVVLSAEAKQKTIDESTIALFVTRVAGAGIGRAIYAAFGTAQPQLDIERLETQALERHAVLLTVLTEPERLLQAALFWTSTPLSTALREFPTLLARRLVDFGCDPMTGEEWAAIVSASVGGAQ
jgi:SacI restriction endonuclease